MLYGLQGLAPTSGVNVSTNLMSEARPAHQLYCPTAPSPLTVVTDSFCSNGLRGLNSSNGAVCCVAACGKCGGPGCSQVGAPALDADDCCATEIADFGKLCSITGAAPCIINGGECCPIYTYFKFASVHISYGTVICAQSKE